MHKKMLEKENPFKLLETDGQVPVDLKKALISEIDTIRNTSVIVELFVGNFLNVLTKSLSIDDKMGDFKQ